MDTHELRETRLLEAAVKVMEPLGLRFRIRGLQVRHGNRQRDAVLELRVGGRPRSRPLFRRPADPSQGTVKEYGHVQGDVTLHAVAVNGASPTALCSRRAGHREAQRAWAQADRGANVGRRRGTCFYPPGGRRGGRRESRAAAGMGVRLQGRGTERAGDSTGAVWIGPGSTFDVGGRASTAGASGRICGAARETHAPQQGVAVAGEDADDLRVATQWTTARSEP